MEASLNGHRKRLRVIRGQQPIIGAVFLPSVTLHGNPQSAFNQPKYPHEADMVFRNSFFLTGLMRDRQINADLVGIDLVAGQLPNAPFAGLIMHPALNLEFARIPWPIAPRRGRDQSAALLVGRGRTDIGGPPFWLNTTIPAGEGFEVRSPEFSGGFIGCLRKTDDAYGNAFVRVQCVELKKTNSTLNSSFPFLGDSQLPPRPSWVAVTVSTVQGDTETVIARRIALANLVGASQDPEITIGLGRHNNQKVFVVNIRRIIFPSFPFFADVETSASFVETISFPYSPATDDDSIFGVIRSEPNVGVSSFEVYSGTFDENSLHPNTLEIRHHKHGDLVDVAFQSSMVGFPDVDQPFKFSTGRSAWEFSEHPDRIVTQTVRGIDGRSVEIPSGQRAAQSPTFSYVPANIQNVGPRLVRIPTGQRRTRALTLAGIARTQDESLLEDHADKLPVFPQDGKIHIGQKSFSSATLQFNARARTQIGPFSSPEPGWKIWPLDFTIEGIQILPEGANLSNEIVLGTVHADFARALSVSGNPPNRLFFQHYPFIQNVRCESFSIGDFTSSLGMLRGTGQHLSQSFSYQQAFRENENNPSAFVFSWSILVEAWHEVYCTFYLAVEGPDGISGSRFQFLSIDLREGAVREGPVFVANEGEAAPVLVVEVHKRTVMKISGSYTRTQFSGASTTTVFNLVGDSAVSQQNNFYGNFLGRFFLNRQQTAQALDGQAVTLAMGIFNTVGQQLFGLVPFSGRTPNSGNDHLIDLTVQLS
jgi:hypothetical protein